MTVKRFKSEAKAIQKRRESDSKAKRKRFKSEAKAIQKRSESLSSPQINRILNEAFGKAISTNMLRHIYLTEQYKNVPAIADMQELAQSMGHSQAQAMEYVKKK